MLALADGAIGLHFVEILMIAIPILIALGFAAFLRGVRRGLHDD